MSHVFTYTHLVIVGDDPGVAVRVNESGAAFVDIDGRLTISAGSPADLLALLDRIRQAVEEAS